LSLAAIDGMAANLTCVTDSFTGTNGSAPDATNWFVQKVNGTFTPSIYNNRLRLTDTSNNSSTRVTNQYYFPFGNNIVVTEFDYWSYGGDGADGIAAIFSDPDKPTS
jgi:MSHA biogenesis protein MshQ